MGEPSGRRAREKQKEREVSKRARGKPGACRVSDTFAGYNRAAPLSMPSQTDCQYIEFYFVIQSVFSM
jgi:hypothetical protein